MPQLKEDLVFSANNLQVFEDCERRFELRYLKELKWPAVETEPVLESEQFLANGRRFHEMIQRDILGISIPDSLVSQDVDINEWWECYKNHNPVNITGAFFPEKTLSGILDGCLMTATYDLIVHTDNGHLIVYDWKTWKNPHSPEWMKNRLQARLYPWLLMQVGNTLGAGEEVAPEKIEMKYWYASAPEKSFAFTYSQRQFEDDTDYLRSIVQRILATPEDAFVLTDNLKHCDYCPYRSYCGRGKKAGSILESNRMVSEDTDSFLGSLDDYESIAF